MKHSLDSSNTLNTCSGLFLQQAEGKAETAQESSNDKGHDQA